MGLENRWIHRISEELDLPGEPMPGQPIVELAGERQVLVENHRGVTQYSCETICIRVKFGIIQVQGTGLEICRMTKAQLIIRGRIDSITLCRR